jgi:yeast amino acid transporter
MIGTGLLFQSGHLLALAGPISLLLAYVLMGTVIYAALVFWIRLQLLMNLDHHWRDDCSVTYTRCFVYVALSIFISWSRMCLQGPWLIINQGFACGWIYIFGYMTDFANKAVVFSQYITYWTGPQNQTGHTVLEISLFFVVPILVNILTIRKYGEVEFWLTAIKVEVIIVIIIVGFVIAVGGSPSPRLGTDPTTFEVVACNETLARLGNCTTAPGIHCLYLLKDIY